MRRSGHPRIRGIALTLAVVLLGGGVPVPAAEGATGSAVGRVTVLRKGMPSTAEASWKVRFTSQDGGTTEPIELPLRNGVYETPELPLGSYQVQVVDAFGQSVGAPQTVMLREGAIRFDLRLELVQGPDGLAGGEKKSHWKVVAIVGGAAAALALASGGGGGDGPGASPSK